jgi:hypothetical protein
MRVSYQRPSHCRNIEVLGCVCLVCVRVRATAAVVRIVALLHGARLSGRACMHPKHCFHLTTQCTTAHGAPSAPPAHPICLLSSSTRGSRVDWDTPEECVSAQAAQRDHSLVLQPLSRPRDPMTAALQAVGRTQVLHWRRQSGCAVPDAACGYRCQSHLSLSFTLDRCSTDRQQRGTRVPVFRSAVTATRRQRATSTSCARYRAHVPERMAEHGATADEGAPRVQARAAVRRWGFTHAVVCLASGRLGGAQTRYGASAHHRTKGACVVVGGAAVVWSSV